MLRTLLGAIASLALLTQPASPNIASPHVDSTEISVNELKPRISSNDEGIILSEDRYDVTLNGKSYLLTSDAQLPNAAQTLNAFLTDNELAMARMATLTGIEKLSIDNAEDYATAIIPIITATEYQGHPITEQDQQDASTVLEMCFLLMGEKNAQQLADALSAVATSDPSTASFAQAVDSVSAYAPALSGDNSDFIQDAQALAAHQTTTTPLSATPGIGGNGSFSLTRANQYAKRWASSPNPQYKYYANADCANFASQIMKAGGFVENTTWQYNSGSPTRSWTVANDFANKFGITRRTTSLSTFTARAVVGRPVGLYSGGRVYHIGYVMSKASSTTHLGQSYRPLTIAQHSTDYVGTMDNGAAKRWRDQEVWVTP